jgi:lipoate---protein ligase
LIEGWRSLGVKLDYGNLGRGDSGQANCFQTATQADLVTESGIKLIGSAQAWQHTTVLQHGSMQIHRDLQLWNTVFNTELMPLDISMPSVETIVETLIQSATQYFKGQFKLSEFTHAEWRSIQALP